MSSQKQKKAIKKADTYNAIKTRCWIEPRGNFREKTVKTDLFGLYGQVNKRIRWMPRQ